MRIFIDTSAFIALSDQDDQYHLKAKEYYLGQFSQKPRFLTSNFIVCETLNYLRVRVSYHSTIRFRESLYKSRIIEIAAITPDLEEKAFRIMKRYKDKTFSFTDCTSFALMEGLGIATAFGFDEHFQQYGQFVLNPTI
jgi:predicted nucleic acid-binding protein